MKLFLFLAALFDGFGNEHINKFFTLIGLIVVLIILFAILGAIVGG
ncbi:MAG: hypothetical protein WCR55_03710 [Lentisphaerota bacterium]